MHLSQLRNGFQFYKNKYIGTYFRNKIFLTLLVLHFNIFDDQTEGGLPFLVAKFFKMEVSNYNWTVLGLDSKICVSTSFLKRCLKMN